MKSFRPYWLMNCKAPPLQAAKPIPKIEPMFASAVECNTPSSTQRTVSMAWMNSRRSRTSSADICASGFSKRLLSSAQRCFLPFAG